MSRKRQLFANQKPFIRTNRSLFPPKTTLFHPPPPIATSLNLLSTKEYSCSFNLCSKSLRCKAGTSHRFKSLPAIPGKLAVFCVAGYLMNAGHFRKNNVSTGDLNRGRRTESRVLFGYFLHDAKSDNSFSLQRTSRFSKPRFSSPQWRLRTNKIKSFEGENRGFANLDSAHQNYNFAQTQLNPFAAPRLSHKIGSPQPRRAYINGAISFSSPPYNRRMNVFFFRSAA